MRLKQTQKELDNIITCMWTWCSVLLSLGPLNTISELDGYTAAALMCVSHVCLLTQKWAGQQIEARKHSKHINLSSPSDSKKSLTIHGKKVLFCSSHSPLLHIQFVLSELVRKERR